MFQFAMLVCAINVYIYIYNNELNVSPYLIGVKKKKISCDLFSFGDV